jgi:hypothetical protein
LSLIRLVERKRVAKIEQKRLVDLQVAAARRKEAADIKQANMEAAKLKQEMKRNSLLEKHARHESLIDEITIEKEAESAVRREQNTVIELKRKRQLQQAKAKEEAIKSRVQSKIEQQEARLRELAERRIKEQIAIKAEKERQLQLKSQNLERIKKAQEDQLRKTKHKAEEHERKCDDLKKSKDNLMKLRRKATAEAKVKKDRLRSILDTSRTGRAGIERIKKLLDSGLMEPKPESRTVRKMQKRAIRPGSPRPPSPSVAVQIASTPLKVRFVASDSQEKLNNKTTRDANGKKDVISRRMSSLSRNMLKLAEPKKKRAVHKKHKDEDDNECLESAERVVPTPHKSPSPSVASDDLGILMYRCRSHMVEDKNSIDELMDDEVGEDLSVSENTVRV